MKKFLIFSIIACLALAPVSAFANENGNDNDNDYAVEDCCIDENDEENDVDENEVEENDNEVDENEAEANDNEVDENEVEVTPVYVEGVEEGIMAISAELGETWELVSEAGEELVFEVPSAGTFYISGTVVTNGLSFAVLVNGETIAYGSEDYELSYELELEAGDTVVFTQVVEAVEENDENDNDENDENDENDNEEAAAVLEWNITIREVVTFEIDENEVEENDENDNEAYVPVEEIADEVNPLAGLDIVVIEGVEFVGFRAAANAFGFESLAWDNDTATVTVEGVGYFTVEAAGGFNDNGTVFVPVAFVQTFFA